MKTKIFILGAATLLLSACQDELQQPDNQTLGGGNSILSINVVTENIESKGLVTGTYLASGAAIGVTVTNTSGGNYDNTAYNNIKFTSSGTSTSQTWSGASTVKLSATEGYCYAYYPYSSSASSIASIPVTAGGTDYLYATRASVNDKSKTASLTMKHALSAIRFALKRGTYGGTGKVTAVSVTSSALGKTGTLNATTGAVTAANKGTAVSQTANLTLSSTAQNVDVVMVPSGTAGAITLSVTIDGKAYSTSVSSTTIAQGSCYTYTITVNAGNLALSGVNVGAWGYNSAGSPTITAAGYTVTFAGDYSEMAFKNTVSGNTATILACSLGADKPKKVSITGTATLSQTVDLATKRRTITLSNIGSNITITFNGLGYEWDNITTDGVYYVNADGDFTATASSDCIGVALINNANNQRFMIEKHESNNQLYTTAASGKNNNYQFYWGDLQNNYSEITDKTSSSTAQADFDGAIWSNTLVNVLSGGYYQGTSYTSYATIGAVLRQFRNEKHLGLDNWFIPSLGQLYLIYKNLSAINSALSAIGGTQLASTYYWSSSEYSILYAWNVGMSNGYVSWGYKTLEYRVRLIMDL